MHFHILYIFSLMTEFDEVIHVNLLSYCIQSKMLEGAFFVDCGTDLGSGRLVPGKLTYLTCLEIVSHSQFFLLFSVEFFIPMSYSIYVAE